MKDTELLGILLQMLYDRRRERKIVLKSSDFEFDFPQSEIKRIFEHLYEMGLADATTSGNKTSGTIFANPRITPLGASVIEGNTKPPIPISLQNDRADVQHEAQMKKPVRVFLCTYGHRLRIELC